MANPNADPEMPRTQPSPARTTEEVFPRDEDAEGVPARRAGDDDSVRGDRMPKGADEPGAGL